MGNVSFTIEEENLICIYHKHARRRTIAAISDALPDMDGDMRPLAEQTIHKLHNMTDAAFEVPSRFMRKIVCRLRLSEVSRQ